MTRAFLVLLVAFGLPAMAQQKISILAFEGPGGATARNQVVAAMCELAECVPQAKVSAGKKPDWKKAKKLGVKFIVDGKVVKKGKKATLELSVFNKAGKPKYKHAWPMTGSELGVLQLGQAQNALAKAMGLEEARPPPEKKDDEKKDDGADTKKDDEKKDDGADTKKDDEKKDDKKDQKETREEKKQREKEEREEKKRKQEEERAKEEEEAKKQEEEKKDDDSSDEGEKKNRHTVLGVDVGMEFAGKYFSYTQTERPNLRSYNAPLTVAPSFRLEFYPVALATQGLAAGLGIDGGAAIVVGLKSRLPSATGGAPISYPTSLLRVDFGARFRIRPFAGSDAAIVPAVGVRIHNFKVSQAEDGSVIDGLPGVSYTAIKIGLGGEIPIGERLAFGAAFTAMPLVGYGEIVSVDWFPRGGGFGFDINAWMTFKIAGPLHIKVAGNFTRYGLAFETQPTDTYIASGAVDVHAGGFVGLRLAF
jgi:hypothetical protein